MEKAMTNRIAASVAVVATCWSACALGQTGTVAWEDLAKCKLPNGLTILPSDGTGLARKQGSIFSFAANKLSPRPEMKGKWSPEDFVRGIRQAKAGDIMYGAAEGGGFFVVSGRITDLGKHYLHEFDGKELPRPKIITGKADDDDVPGLMTGIEGLTGHCFILETMDRKYVLLRIVSQDRQKKRRARVQWVYQPDGTRTFRIPKGAILRESHETAPKQPSWEDLSQCKLPNGTVVLPSDGTLLARKEGSIFSFAANKLSPRPEKKGSPEDTVRAIRQAKAGDIMYFTDAGGCFFVISGRITDLGKHYLHEFDGKELPRPKIITGKEDREDVPGLMTGIDALTGHCFILETMDRKYVLLRIVSQDRRKERRARVQWVYQPNGTRVFNVPKSKIQTQAPAVVGRPVQEGKAALSPIMKLDVRDFAKAGDTHKENRKKLVELSLALVASKDADIGNRHLACILLGKLRAPEGAPVLAARINEDLSLISTEISVENSYRCVGALIKIGVPGALASMDQMEIDTRSKPPKDGDAREWNFRIQLRRKLLALVVLNVYGEKLGKIVLEDRIAQAKDPKAKAAFQEALEAFPTIKNWLPKEKTPATRPAK